MRKISLDPNTLIDLVQEGVSIREMARFLNVSVKTIQRNCETFHIPMRDRLEQSLAKRRRQIPDSLFALPLTPDESWLLGLLMTDGCIKDNGTINLDLGDEDGVQYAKQIIGFGNIRIVEPYGRTKVRMYHYQANSRNLANRLATFGLIPRKTQILAFPNPSDVSLPDFIRGLWDGDGGWSTDRRDGALVTSFGCASEPFIHALRSITAEVTGSMAHLSPHPTKQYWQLRYYGQYARTLARWLYDTPSLCHLSRKHLIVTPFL